MGRRIIIDIEMPENRNYAGVIQLRDADTGERLPGEWPAIGRAALTGPGNWRNPNTTRDPLQENGNTPTGTYDVPTWLPTGPGSLHPDASTYGANGVLPLIPVSGDAAKAADNGRVGFLIHEGHTMANGELMPTLGCERVYPGAVNEILDAINTYSQNGPNPSCELTEVTPQVGAPGANECLSMGEEPPNSFLAEIGASSPSLPIERDVLRSFS